MTNKGSNSQYSASGKHLIEVLKIALGVLLLVIGIVGLILPILQGLLFIAAGLLLLADAIPFIDRRLKILRHRFVRLDKVLKLAERPDGRLSILRMLLILVGTSVGITIAVYILRQFT